MKEGTSINDNDIPWSENGTNHTDCLTSGQPYVSLNTQQQPESHCNTYAKLVRRMGFIICAIGVLGVTTAIGLMMGDKYNRDDDRYISTSIGLVFLGAVMAVAGTCAEHSTSQLTF